MELGNARDYVGGWFIGAFEPTMLATQDFEVCIKRYSQGDREPTHYQLHAVEFTLVIHGQCRIGQNFLGPDDVLRIDPLEAADFEALTDVVLVAVKTPSISSDKRLGEPDGA
jgi:hypothetical protein